MATKSKIIDMALAAMFKKDKRYIPKNGSSRKLNHVILRDVDFEQKLVWVEPEPKIDILVADENGYIPMDLEVFHKNFILPPEIILPK